VLSPQVLAGIYPIAQIQEPYTAVGFLASRIPVQALLHLRHPEAEDPSAEHPWCAWDICEGESHSLSARPSLLCCLFFPSSLPRPLFPQILLLVKQLFTHPKISAAGPARSLA
jgi:hypothetical protein